MVRERLWALCLKCEYVWLPDKSRGKLRCSECRSRDVFRGTINAILDHVKKEALKQKTERVRGGVCPTCGVRPGCVCRWCGAGFSSYRARIKHVRDKHPKKVKPPGGQRKERAQDPSLEESKEPSIITQARREHLDTVEERRRARERAADDDSGKGASKLAGRKISADTEQTIHKRIGVKADKLERIVAAWEKAPQRTEEIDETGRPRIDEEHNVEWIHLVGKVTWQTAHKIFHEVLMKDAACTLPIGYKRMES